jgi:signal transduction histidine kinase
MENLDAVEVLRRTAIFQELTDSELRRVAALCNRESYPAGYIIQREGDEAGFLFILESGCVALEMTVRWGPGGTSWQWPTEVVTAPGTFAWSALVKPHVLTATSRTLLPTSVLKVQGQALRALFIRCPRLGRGIMAGVAEVISQRLRNARRTAAQSVAIFSHDLKTPLAAVEYFNQVILGGYAGPLNNDQREMLERSSQRIQQLLALLSDLLEAAQVERGLIAAEFCEVPLGPIIGLAVAEVQPAATASGITLDCRLAGDLGESTVAPRRLQQALGELLENAVKFTPCGGGVSVTAVARDSVIEIAVTDDGIGVPDFEQALVFGDCYRGQSCGQAEGTGTGMGLGIARRIVEAHGGAISVESPPDGRTRGSRFKVAFPRKLACSQSTARRAAE